MRVQLVTFAGCPNADAAREALRRALAVCQVESSIEEIDNSAPDTPEPFRDWGSPTVLFDGVDSAGEKAPNGRSCRIYRDASGLVSGSPLESLLVAAIQNARQPS